MDGSARQSPVRGVDCRTNSVRLERRRRVLQWTAQGWYQAECALIALTEVLDSCDNTKALVVAVRLHCSDERSSRSARSQDTGEQRRADIVCTK
jgi:hypothetical protein